MRSSTLVINGTQVKIYAWYDNEWGYVNRTAELVRLVGAAAVTMARAWRPRSASTC